MTDRRVFADRAAAGRSLARALEGYRDADPVVLALPRGGVPVAAAIADALGAPLDVILVRKLGAPGHPELGMGAIGEGGARVLNPDIIAAVSARAADIDAVEARERAELQRRAARYRQGRAMIPLVGRTVIVVDDGIATGGTMRAAIAVARAHNAAQVVVAVPVAAPTTLAELAPLVDAAVALEKPIDMIAIGYWYRDFRQTSDGEVIALLRAARERATPHGSSADPPS